MSQKYTSAFWGLIGLMRPKDWLKNTFVLAPLIFTSQFLDIEAVSSALLTFFYFCVVSSACYIVNDIHDIEQDRLHPQKSIKRPLASGIVKIPQALKLLLFLYALLISGFYLQTAVMPILLLYLILNLAYTYILKYMPVIDIFSVSTCFVLRVYAGGMALSVTISSWMFVTTLCLALFLASLKRRQELCVYGSAGRKVLKLYNFSLVTRYAEMSAMAALFFYSMFVMSVRPQMLITVPLVLFGFYRYWFVVEAKGGGESPADTLLSDYQLLLTVVLWVCVCAWSVWPVAG